MILAAMMTVFKIVGSLLGFILTILFYWGLAEAVSKELEISAARQNKISWKPRNKRSRRSRYKPPARH